jgi:hypothetical protein
MTVNVEFPQCRPVDRAFWGVAAFYWTTKKTTEFVMTGRCTREHRAVGPLGNDRPPQLLSREAIKAFA